MRLKKTERGFRIREFRDLYRHECSMQESSLAFQPAVWLGVGDSRMHLDRRMAKRIGQYLLNFARQGDMRSVKK